MAIDTLESAKPLDETADIRKDAIHVHGTDLCSTKDLINYFKAYNPKHVEWINDSSCNIVFSDENSTKRAMAGKLRDKSAFMSIDGPKLPSFLEFEAGEDCTASSTGMMEGESLLAEFENPLHRQARTHTLLVLRYY